MDKKKLDALCMHAHKITGVMSDYDALLDRIGDAQIVLLGEATHGTQQFYEIRAEITKRLITEKNFNAITIEGDWPDAYQVNRYVHDGAYKTATEALASFDRFPTWMWRNVTMVHFVEWLHAYNKEQEQLDKVGFYGLDMYSLYRSVDVIIKYLDKIDPEAAAEARYHYSCFNQYRQDPQYYGYAVYARIIQSCAGDVIEQLQRLQQDTWDWLAQGKLSADEAFYIEQNARVVKNAEAYYRALFINEKNTWNLRDAHLFETLNALMRYHQLKGIEKPKMIIWAHNSHIGDARATQMSLQGEYNIGQLAKEAFGAGAVSIGFTTYEGTVSAAADWHAPVERKNVRAAIADSYEVLFHAAHLNDFYLLFNAEKIVPDQLLERAIGVVYRPETERLSHYFYAQLAKQFDAVVHCDKTSALEPLDKTAVWVRGEAPEAYPTGF